ncbi:MAG: T9SS type A sorting domain-containing protein, partial [Balneolales bacterium]|nr:T9SS type A sorting domain-containing protein [Balneolales bacterium]
WNIGEIDNNNVDYNSENDVLIVSERGGTENPVVSVATMANTSSVLAIDNTFEGFGSGTRFGTFDGFSEAEKRFSLFAEQQNTSVSGTDVSAVVATGPYFIPPGESISVGFIYAFGETDEKLIDQINAARTLNAFTVSELNSNINNSFPSETSLFQNYPNPFNPSTTFNFTLGETQNVELSIYNVLGQKVRTVINTELSAGIHNLSVSFNELAGGLYFAVLETSGKRELIKLTLIK